MIVSLTGNNSFAIKLRLDELMGGFLKSYGELALEKIDAEEADAQAILEAIQALPFLAQRKMVVVRAMSGNKVAAEQIEQIISSVPDSTDLVLYEPATDKRTSFYKALRAKTELEEYNQLDPQGLAHWLAEEAKKRGGELGLGEATYFVERVGQNQMLLSNELDKLLTYNQKISRAAISELIEPTPQTKIFDLLDAAFGGNKKRALQIYDEQRAQKVEPQAIMAMVAWQLQLLALAKLGEGKPPIQIAKDAGVSSYPLVKASNLVNKLSLSRLKEITDEALRIDWRSKTSSIDLDEALKTYIATL
jgi:DNA polymerase-3 subunit delta